MKIQLSYTELQNYIAKHYYNKGLEIGHVDEKTVSVSAAVKIAMFTKSVTLNLAVERVEGTDITLAYSGGMGIDLILRGVLAFVKSQLPKYGEIVETEAANSIVLHLGKIGQLEKVFHHLTLLGIRFAEDGIVMYGSLKS